MTVIWNVIWAHALCIHLRMKWWLQAELSSQKKEKKKKKKGSNGIERRSDHAFLHQKHFLFPEGVSLLRFCALIVHGSRIWSMETRAASRENWWLKKRKKIEKIHDLVHIPDSYYFINRINTFTDELHVMTERRVKQLVWLTFLNYTMRQIDDICIGFLLPHSNNIKLRTCKQYARCLNSCVSCVHSNNSTIICSWGKEINSILLLGR